MSDIINKRMNFEEWADLLFLRERLVSNSTEVDRQPWRCTGACGQLMYGQEWIDGKLYPSSENTPVGMFYSKEFSHICHVCWQMLHALEQSPTGYWQGLSAGDTKRSKGLRPGDNYLTT